MNLILFSASSALNGIDRASSGSRKLSREVERMVVEESEDEDFVREVPARRGSSVKQDIPAIVESKYV